MSKDSKLSTKHISAGSGSLSDEDDIDLFELTHVVLQGWKAIVAITVFCIGLAIAYAFYVPEVFKAETLLVRAQDNESSASSGPHQFGGLAAMVGISIPSSSNIDRVLATLQTRAFLKKFISSRKLLPIIFNNLWDKNSSSWRLIEGQEEITIDNGIVKLRSAIEVEKENSGLVTLSISWQDPEVAAQWANDLVKQLNEQLRERAIADSKKRVGYLEQELAKTTLQDMRAVLYNLLESEKQKAMLANVNEDFALEVIDPAVVPKVHDEPKRERIIALGGACGGFLGVFAVFFVHFLQKIKIQKT